MTDSPSPIPVQTLSYATESGATWRPVVRSVAIAGALIGGLAVVDNGSYVIFFDANTNGLIPRFILQTIAGISEGLSALILLIGSIGCMRFSPFFRKVMIWGAIGYGISCLVTAIVPSTVPGLSLKLRLAAVAIAAFALRPAILPLLICYLLTRPAAKELFVRR